MVGDVFATVKGVKADPEGNELIFYLGRLFGPLQPGEAAPDSDGERLVSVAQVLGDLAKRLSECLGCVLLFRWLALHMIRPQLAVCHLPPLG